MTRVRRIGVISLANVVAAIAFVTTLFFVVLILLVVLPAREGVFSQYFNVPRNSAVGFFLIVPFIYAAIGWVVGALWALIYNLVARFTGGVQLQLEHREPPVLPPATWSPLPSSNAPQPPPSAPRPLDPES